MSKPPPPLTHWLATAALLLFLLGCAPTEIPVTRLVEVQVPVTVEVTGTPLVTRVVETSAVEVTRIVPATPTRFQGRLIVGIPEYPTTLDIPQASTTTTRMVAWHLYDSLVTSDVSSTILPALAERWEISEDGLTTTFYLRRGVQFHNGEAFTADAVRFSWERGRQPANENSAGWQAVQEVVVLDDYTVQLTTAERNVALLRLIADQWAIVPPSYIAQVGEAEFALRPVGTGPFQFAEAERNGFVTLEANTSYWQPNQPRLRQITFRWIPNPADKISLLQAGRVHVLSDLAPEEAIPLAADPTLRLISYPEDRIYFIGFNRAGAGADSPLEDSRVRLALNHAINRPAMLQTLFGNLARLSTGMVLPSNLGYDPTLEPIPYDPVLARSLLQQAGVEEGFALEMACPEEAYPLFNEVCAWVAADLAEIGVDVTLTFVPPATYFDTPPRDYPALFGDRRTGDGTEAYSRLNGLLGGSDYATWYDEEIGRLIRRLRETADPTARAELYQQIQAEMQTNPSFIYLYEPLRFEAVHATVQNYTPRAHGRHTYADVFLAR
jgi:peptide/nickel transport system substrate-binding protein